MNGMTWNIHLIGSIICVIISLIISWIFKPQKEKKLKTALLQCKIDLRSMMEECNCHPLLLRLAWTDASTYDQTIKEWPTCGGCQGSIRFHKELEYPSNKGLSKAMILLARIKRSHRIVSWADIIQMGGALAIELTGGPVIDMIYGRQDCNEDECNHMAPRHEPSVLAPYPDGSPSAEVHLRNIFYRLGFTNKELVALYGAHTLGRAFSDRTGVCPHSTGEQGATIHTSLTSTPKGENIHGVGMPGGMSWTKEWLKFDNSYFVRSFESTPDPTLLWLPTDAALANSPEFSPYVDKYARNCDEFFADYAAAHKKMSELGARFIPAGGISV